MIPFSLVLKLLVFFPAFSAIAVVVGRQGVRVVRVGDLKLKILGWNPSCKIFISFLAHVNFLYFILRKIDACVNTYIKIAQNLQK